MPHFSISLDDMSEDLFNHMGTHQDGGAGHYARYTGADREEAKTRALNVMAAWLEENLYISDDYGHPLGSG